MTSNLGAAEMSSILRPNLGFAVRETERRRGPLDEKLADKVSRAGVEAARRKFSPEFMNRIDKTVVFRPLGDRELRKILTLELNMVQQRLFDSAHGAPFVFSVTPEAQGFLLREGTDVKYGARHLKRALERHLVHPLSNLIATDQVHGGDLVRVDYDSAVNRLTFFIDAEEMTASAMAQMAGVPVSVPMGAYVAGATAEQPRAINVRSTKRPA
jgi:ATP-dependent Clp protease ATP-binding subunit ClpA